MRYRIRYHIETFTTVEVEADNEDEADIKGAKLAVEKVHPDSTVALEITQIP